MALPGESITDAVRRIVDEIDGEFRVEEIGFRVDCSAHRARKALEELIPEGIIYKKRRKRENGVYHFVYTKNPDAMEDPTPSEVILELINSNPNSAFTVKDVAAEVEISEHATYNYLRSMSLRGLIRRRIVRRNHVYYAKTEETL